MNTGGHTWVDEPKCLVGLFCTVTSLSEYFLYLGTGAVEWKPLEGSGATSSSQQRMAQGLQAGETYREE